MSLSITRSVATLAGVSLLTGAALLLGAVPAQAAVAPLKMSLEIAGPDGVFVPVASGAQFAVSSITDTTARWTLTNPTGDSHTGYYLYTYGPDCAVSDITIAAGGTYVCTEVIEPSTVLGVRDLGALGGLFEEGDFAISYPLYIDFVDDADGKSFTLDKTTVSAGGTIVITGAGFDEDDTLTGVVASDPIDLGSFETVDGGFTYSLTLPAGFDPGVHTITLYSNGVAYAVRSFELLGAAQLSATGVDSTVSLALGGGLIVFGMSALLLLRRRKQYS